MPGERESELFELRGVCASRGDRRVLHDAELRIGSGSTAIVGPSGSGKSTLLRLLNRLADPDAGTVAYRGRDVRELDVVALRRDVVLVAQVPVALPGTVADNVRYGPALAGREADVPRALRLAGLPDVFAGRAAAELSVGEQQRVALARALALAPSVLLLDEPTSALDPRARDLVEDALGALRAQAGLSLVLVTHDPEQAARLAGTVVRLSDGRVRGTAEVPAA